MATGFDLAVCYGSRFCLSVSAFRSVAGGRHFVWHDVGLSCLQDGCSTIFKADAVHHVVCVVNVVQLV